MKPILVKKRIKTRECMISLAMLFFGLIILISALQYGPGVRMFPALTGSCFIFIGAFSFMSSLKKEKQKETEKLMNKQELLIFGIMLVTALFIRILGFYVSLCLGMMGVCSLVIRRKNFKKALICNGIFCFVTAAVLFIIFHLVLHVPTPSGLLI